MHPSTPFSLTTASPAQTLRLTPAEQDRLRRRFATLTARELDVMLAVCEGGSNEEIAARLCIASPTLRTHLMRTHQKLGTSRKSDLVRLALGQLLHHYRTTERGVSGPV